MNKYDEKTVQAMLPPEFKYLGESNAGSQFNNTMYYSVVHREFNNGIPFVTDDLVKLASACWKFVLKPKKKLSIRKISLGESIEK